MRRNTIEERALPAARNRLPRALFGILRRSPVYLLDEPTMGLSPEAARILRNFLVDLNREFKVTVLYATHHPLELRRWRAGL
jgi:ABC-type uncharacterized transport system ATPase subunit